MDALEKSFGLMPWIVALLVLGTVVLPQMIRILREYERGVIFRLGKTARRKRTRVDLADSHCGPDGEDGPSRHHHRRSQAGSHDPRQRARDGGRGRLLPRR